jgi:D-alanyl-lipoteichoic acid acyltransferase DltB (MBOAT superfamily)
VNILIVFLVSGLWHGANWTFLIWGLLHGIFFLAFTTFMKEAAAPRDFEFSPRPILHRLALMLLTFHLVCFAWIFFRAESLGDALLIVQKIAVSVFTLNLAGPGTSSPFQWIALLLAVEWFARNTPHGLARIPVPQPIRWGLYYGLVLIIIFATPLSYVPFIYFQF